MAYGRPHIAVEDYNGNFMMVGLANGADVSGGTVVTGAAMGDLKWIYININWYGNNSS